MATPVSTNLAASASEPIFLFWQGRILALVVFEGAAFAPALVLTGILFVVWIAALSVVKKRAWQVGSLHVLCEAQTGWLAGAQD